MRKLVLFALTAAVIALTSCSKPKGQLTGIYGNITPEATPYGMVRIPRGSFLMGPNDQSATWAIQPNQRDVTVESFWMDITEITNGEYKQFVLWVRDSIARTQLARMEVDVLGVEAEDAKYFSVKYDPYNEAADPDTLLNWKVRIPWKAKWTYEGDEEENATYLAVNSVFYQSGDKTEERQLNAHVMNYSYKWLARDQAKLPGNSFNPKTGKYHDWAEVTIDTAYYDETGKIINKVIKKKLRQRGDLISRRIINIYPDTMCWMTEFTYSYNEPAMLNYFSHPSYGYFPVVGVTWEQAQAFCHWRNAQYQNVSKMPRAQEYRLPTEAEWEYAARGGKLNSAYPWGGPYIRDAKGCFMANFKPLRGNYTEDGYFLPSSVGTYDPNDYGLYDMAGNVSEWIDDTYDETTSSFALDMNPSYKYEAREGDLKIMRRKVIKGGSWKDVGAYLQCGMRDFEYQDVCRPSIGFRCVRTHIGD
ncbi:MAG: SUMF1/EgtB/PvdO family nonheme iron enzyme [Paludibacteraceae bacterium]|nr:SUMF1/EgtB/PvdO family nonheme iron enzyme [Paludibacteraceae bacterium]MBR6519765.1 SUMF1/EgtB/PvdO family nonheme iron enzyme [Paludibacteraceae bacterium]